MILGRLPWPRIPWSWPSWVWQQDSEVLTFETELRGGFGLVKAVEQPTF